MPFGLEIEAFTEFARAQFQRRFARIEPARGKSLTDVLSGGEWNNPGLGA